MLKMMGEHVTPNLPKAQAIKDATMSVRIDDEDRYSISIKGEILLTEK